MPSWSYIISEIEKAKTIDPATGNATYSFDNVLERYIKAFSSIRKRNVIVYYSDWLNQNKGPNIDLNDSDMIGFMNCVDGLDTNKGLDLIIHTPGGNPLATEGIVKYLHKIFGDDIEIFVPHMAMSAGTMFACSCKRIWMGKESYLGPIDPQFSGIPAYNIKLEFEKAKEELISKPKSFEYWKILLSKYPPAFYYTALDSIKLSSSLVKDWLNIYMFKDENKEKLIDSIINKLNVNTGSHAKHFDIDKCKEMGLKVLDLESNHEIQDAALSIYHCCTIIGSKTTTCKLIVNQNMKQYVVHGIINGIIRT